MLFNGQEVTGATFNGVDVTGGIELDGFLETFLPQEVTITQIEHGHYFTLYLGSNGHVWATGRNNFGQLGIGTNVDHNAGDFLAPPIQITNADGSAFSGVSQISVGYSHSIFLKRDKSVWTTGYNGTGQLGDGTTEDRNRPVQILALSEDVVQVSAGKTHSVFLKSNGSVLGVGSNNRGQLGDGTQNNRYLPVSPKVSENGIDLSAIAEVRGCAGSTIYRGLGGEIHGAGFSGSGQLGNFEYNNVYPILLKNNLGYNFSGAEKIYSNWGAYHTIIKTENDLWGVGNNGYYQLGINNAQNQASPQTIIVSDVVDVGIEEFRTTFLKSDGTILQTHNSSDLTAVSVPTTPKSIFVGGSVDQQSYIDLDDKVYYWGSEYNAGDHLPTEIENFWA